MVILARTGVVVPHAFFLILFGVAALWMGYSLDWLLVRWPVAARGRHRGGRRDDAGAGAAAPGTPGAALAVQVVLLGAYLASIAVRTLVRGRNVIPFEVVQTIAGARRRPRRRAVGDAGHRDRGRAALGVASVVLGVACYGVAFAFIERQQHRGRNVYFYTSLAVVLVLVGVTTLLPGQAVTGVAAALAVGCSIGWARFGRLFLLLHTAVYLVAAALACGAIGYDLREVVAGAGPPWALPTAAMLIVLAASGVSAWLASRRSGE